MFCCAYSLNTDVKQILMNSLIGESEHLKFNKRKETGGDLVLDL